MRVQKNVVDPNNLPAPLKITNGKFNDISNTYINNILFLYPCERRNKRLLWLCRCYCGNYFVVEPKSVRSENTSSCGCKFLQRMRNYNIQNSQDLTGQRFGRLLVLNKDQIKNHRQYWRCQCDCGTQCSVCADSLIQNKVHSCGCLVSYAEYEIKRLLDKHHISYQTEYTFNDCRSSLNYLLRFDFAVFYNNNLIGLIEYQGDQHNNKSNPWYSDIMVEHDHQKVEYCKSHQLPLLHLYKNYKPNEVIDIIRRWFPMSVGI